VISTGRSGAGSDTSSTPTRASSLQLDQLIRRRLRAMLRKQERRPGVGNDRADHQRWPNAHFANAGTVRASHGLAISETVSMKKPPTGEPYARKPPVRFGGRGRRNRSRPLSYAVSLRCGVASERSKVQWLWVPAFAGTTADSSVPTTVEEVSQAPARGRQQPRSCRQWRDAKSRDCEVDARSAGLR